MEAAQSGVAAPWLLNFRLPTFSLLYTTACDTCWLPLWVCLSCPERHLGLKQHLEAGVLI